MQNQFHSIKVREVNLPLGLVSEKKQGSVIHFLGVLSKNQTQQEKKRIGNRYCPMQIMKTSLASEVDQSTNALENVCKSVKKVHR